MANLSQIADNSKSVDKFSNYYRVIGLKEDNSYARVKSFNESITSPSSVVVPFHSVFKLFLNDSDEVTYIYLMYTNINLHVIFLN